jgi:hypothetical protein
MECVRRRSAVNSFSLISSAVQLERVNPQLASMTFDETQDSQSRTFSGVSLVDFCVLETAADLDVFTSASYHATITVE